MSDANWVGGFAGGMSIGLAALLLLLGNGKIAGVSGIASGLLGGVARTGFGARLTFLAGLVLGAALYVATTGPLPVTLMADRPGILLAGLLVGAGTRLGSGCTSGHGVCGLARRSPRSLAATLTFMLGGVATVYVLRHLG